MLKEYFFISSEGDVFDTRIYKWHEKEPLRKNYMIRHREINSLADLKATLRAGEYTSLGGHPLYFITSDGEALSFDAARECWREVVWDFMHDASTGWRVVACQVNYEDGDLVCAHSGERIPSAYDG